jgi:hypothetical protein
MSSSLSTHALICSKARFATNIKLAATYPAGIGPVVHGKAVVHQLADGSCGASVVGMLAVVLVPQRTAYGHTSICGSHIASYASCTVRTPDARSYLAVYCAVH